MDVKLYFIIYLFWFLLAFVFIFLDSDPFLESIHFIGFAIIGGTIINGLLLIVNRNRDSIVILKDDTIEFKGSATSNKEIRLSEFDRLFYHEGILASYLQLERDEGERPNWYRANGEVKDEDREKLKKLVKKANRKTKDDAREIDWIQ